MTEEKKEDICIFYGSCKSTAKSEDWICKNSDKRTRKASCLVFQMLRRIPKKELWTNVSNV